MIDYKLIDKIGEKIRQERESGKHDSEIWVELSAHERKQLKMFQEKAEQLLPTNDFLKQRRQNERTECV